MSKVYTDDYLAKIRFLEQTVGETAKYEILDPFSVNPDDAIDVLNATKKIARFMGIPDFLYIVGKAKQKEGIGGKIDLGEKDNTIFIELGENAYATRDTLLAALSHELSHNYMKVRGINARFRYKVAHEMEILTDICAVYLGLGKLLLNGYEVKTTSEQAVPGGIQKTVREIKQGYLNIEQLAFVFHLICSMRNIPLNQALRGVNPEAAIAVGTISNAYPGYFDKKLRDPGFLPGKESELLVTIKDLTFQLLYLKEFINYISSCVDSANTEIETISHSIGIIKTRISGENIQKHYNPCLMYLDSIELARDYAAIGRELSKLGISSQERLNMLIKLTKFLADLDQTFPKPGQVLTDYIGLCESVHANLPGETQKAKPVTLWERVKYSLLKILNPKR